MERPYKDSAKQGDRIHSLVCLSAEVQWVNEANGGVISRAGLSSFRVTTVHVHNDEKRSVESCKLALKTLFWLALRDKHRVVAGDFNLEPHAIRHAVDCVIEQFEGASYEVLHGDRSAEICCVLLNFAKLPQLRGAVKSAVAERWTSEELRLSDNDADSHYPLILELPPLELREGDLRKRSAEAAAKRAQKKSKRSWTKNSRSGAAKRLTCIDICHITLASIYLNRFLCIYVKFKVSGSKFKVSGSKSG